MEAALHVKTMILPGGKIEIHDPDLLRALLGLKTPDAIHAATALAIGCALFITNDRELCRIPGLPVAVLDDIV